MPLNSGAAWDVPLEASMVMSGTERIGLPVIFATPFWYEGRLNTAVYPAPSEKMPPTCQTGSGPAFWPLLLMFGTLPPIAVTQGESSQAAVSGPVEVLPHWLLAIARFCTTPQSPVATSTGMPPAAAVSSPASWEVISGGATLLAASSGSWLSAGVAEITIFAYGAIRWAAWTSRVSSPCQALHDP